MIKASSILYAVLLATSYTLAAPAPQAETDASSLLVPTSTSTLAASSVSDAASISSSAPISASSGGDADVTSTAEFPTTTVPFVDTEPNFDLWLPGDQDAQPSAIRGSTGATILGPENVPLEIENPDLFAPPSTDQGSIPNAKWPFALSHNRLQTGGWARDQNQNAMPIATAMAGVNMRLEANAVRELHWHKTAEWAYVLKGKTQVTAVDTKGRNFVSTVGPGDLWYFPAGIPHSLQATDDDPEGSGFLLVFDAGDFSEEDTFLLSDWINHTPYEVIQKNFKASVEAFSRAPAEDLYIFPALPTKPDSAAPVSPQGTVPNPFTFNLTQVEPTKLAGGNVKIVDSSTFIVSKTIAAAEVTVEPGAIREMHWHPTMDEWSFFLEGEARITIFASQHRARTFTYQAGDVGYVPVGMGHYVENIGNTTLKFLEIFNSDSFEDVSLSQWLALTPPDLVKSHLNLDDETIASLDQFKTKATVL